MRGARLCPRIAALVCALLLLASGRSGSSAGSLLQPDALTEGGLEVLVDGLRMEYDPAPYILPPGRTMVPLRAFFESLGAEVSWDGATRSVTGTRGDRTVRVTIGSRMARVNDLDTLLDIAPEIRNGRTFVPLRFVAEGLDSVVGYEATLREISVWSRSVAIGPLRLPKGTRIRFRPMLVNLFLSDQWELVIGDAAPFPGLVSYTFQGSVGSQRLPLVNRTLLHLGESRKFLPTAITPDEVETAPWVSAQVYQDLKSRGRSDRFVTGGLAANGPLETSLFAGQKTNLVFTMSGKRVQVTVLEASTATGDRFWILDDPENPLVLKFQPVGLPAAGAFGTIGYQIESIAWAP